MLYTFLYEFNVYMRRLVAKHCDLLKCEDEQTDKNIFITYFLELYIIHIYISVLIK